MIAAARSVKAATLSMIAAARSMKATTRSVIADDMERDIRDSDRADNNETVAGRCEESGESSVSELNEAAMSSPITALDQRWDGILRGLAISMQYEETTRSIYGTVENISTQKLCYVQAEPHLKLERQTVAELGPEKLEDLDPGQRVYSSLSVDDEPGLSEIVFNGYVIHMEVFDCDGPGPTAHTGGEGAEGRSESGESGGEHGQREGRGEHESSHKKMKTKPDQNAIRRRFRPGSSQ